MFADLSNLYSHFNKTHKCEWWDLENETYKLNSAIFNSNHNVDFHYMNSESIISMSSLEILVM